AGTVRTTVSLPSLAGSADSRSLVPSALVTVTGTPPAGAAAPSVNEVGTCRSLPTALPTTLIVGGGVTLMVAEVDVTPGPLAWSVVEPTAFPLTVAGAESWPAWTVTGDITVATLLLPVDRFRVRPLAGAAAEMLTVMLELPPTTTGNVVGVKVTFTATLALRE